MDYMCPSSEGWGPLSPNRPVDFTTCFQYGALVSGLSITFIVAALVRIIILSKKQALPHMVVFNKLYSAKLFFSSLAMAAPAAELVIMTSIYQSNCIHTLGLALQTVAAAMAIKLHRKEQMHNPVSSTVLLLFWLASVLVSLMTLRTGFALGLFDTQPYLLVANAVFTLAAAVTLVLECQPKPDCLYEPVDNGQESADIIFDDDCNYISKTPEEKANIFSQIMLYWLSPMIKTGLQKQLEMEDIQPIGYKFRPDVATEKFQHHWKNELKTAKPSLLKATVACYGYNMLMSSLLKLTHDLVSFLNPVLLSCLIGFVANYNSDDAEPIQNGYFYAFAMFMVEVIASIAYRQYWVQGQRAESLMKTTYTTALYRKTLTLSNDARQEHNVGGIVTHMSTDANRVVIYLAYSVQNMWSVPLQIIIALFMLYKMLGWSVFAGVIVMVVSIPTSTYLSRISTKSIIKLFKHRDERIKVLEEVLGGMKIIKLYAWELPFITKLNKIRVELELNALRQYGNVQTVISFIGKIVPFIVTFSTFALYSMVDNMSHGPLNPQLVFVSLSLFNKLRTPVSRAPYLISAFLEAKVAFMRIYDFLMSDEIDFTAIDHMPYDRTSNNTSDSDVLIKVKDASFKWLRNSEPTLTNISIQCTRNELLAVIGKVGSGKSSLASAILGNMVKHSGSVFTQGNIAYVPQVPWIMNATLRDNILFGHLFDQELYDRVIEACALCPDLEILPAGDLTEIGEKGINLSGGQKARVSLARAVYARTDVYILDDPLAAVDAHVGKHIFTKVLGPQGLLRSRARILITNAMQYLKHTDSIVMLENGAIIEQNVFTEAMANEGNIYKFIHKYVENNAESEESSIKSSTSGATMSNCSDSEHSGIKGSSRKLTIGVAAADQINAALARGSRYSYQNTQANSNNENGRTIAAEVNKKGKVIKDTYISYFKACGTRNALLLLIAVFLSSVSSVAARLWLKHWATSNAKVESNDGHSVLYYLTIYGILGLVGSATNAVQSLLLWSRCSVAAATNIHQRMINGVMCSPMSYFDVTPVGQIINRFSSDLQGSDIMVPYQILNVVLVLISVVSAAAVISMSTPVVIVFIVVLSLIYRNLQQQFTHSSRELKRLCSSTRSPVIAHFQESIGGVSTIRAYGQQPRFVFENEKRIEQNMRVNYYYESLNQWLSIRLESLGSLIMLGTTVMSVVSLQYLGYGDSGMVGLTVTYALSLTSSLNLSVKTYTGLENAMVQLERVNEYAQLPSEAPATIEDNIPSSSWPESGAIEFKNYSTRYREGLDLVLKGLSFSVLSRQKVGIVGRTGAGKSSLTLALFRIIEGAGGQITVDGKDISEYGLHDVRSKLSIIPQDPVLFAGTVRENLDPFNKYSDQEIWAALEHSHLADFIRTKDDRLEFEITQGGENFSVGQRQLICLARALLKQAKILVLDEATAAIDNETDSIIQESIRREFKNCTVLTIAHRINTIIDSDMVLVMDGGKTAEYDSPQNLLKIKDGLFAKLVEESKLSNSE